MAHPVTLLSIISVISVSSVWGLSDKCYWVGTSPACEFSTCRADEVVATESHMGGDGIPCLTGRKKYCCKLVRPVPNEDDGTETTTTSPPRPQTPNNCYWSGEAPNCEGSCGEREYVAVLSRHGNGTECVTGRKRLCCKMRAVLPAPAIAVQLVDPSTTTSTTTTTTSTSTTTERTTTEQATTSQGHQCYWIGTSPTCDGWCQPGEYVAAESRKGVDGVTCVTGTKKYCCKMWHHRVPVPIIRVDVVNSNVIKNHMLPNHQMGMSSGYGQQLMPSSYSQPMTSSGYGQMMPSSYSQMMPPAPVAQNEQTMPQWTRIPPPPPPQLPDATPQAPLTTDMTGSNSQPSAPASVMPVVSASHDETPHEGTFNPNTHSLPMMSATESTTSTPFTPTATEVDFQRQTANHDMSQPSTQTKSPQSMTVNTEITSSQSMTMSSISQLLTASSIRASTASPTPSGHSVALRPLTISEKGVLMSEQSATSNAYPPSSTLSALTSSISIQETESNPSRVPVLGENEPKLHITSSLSPLTADQANSATTGMTSSNIIPIGDIASQTAVTPSIGETGQITSLPSLFSSSSAPSLTLLASKLGEQEVFTTSLTTASPVSTTRLSSPIRSPVTPSETFRPKTTSSEVFPTTMRVTVNPLTVRNAELASASTRDHSMRMPVSTPHPTPATDHANMDANMPPISSDRNIPTNTTSSGGTTSTMTPSTTNLAGVIPTRPNESVSSETSTPDRDMMAPTSRPQIANHREIHPPFIAAGQLATTGEIVPPLPATHAGNAILLSSPSQAETSTTIFRPSQAASLAPGELHPNEMQSNQTYDAATSGAPSVPLIQPSGRDHASVDPDDNSQDLESPSLKAITPSLVPETTTERTGFRASQKIGSVPEEPSSLN